MKTLITRADDCGSSRSANRAIAEAVEAGFIRNVSLMAVGSELEDAARLLAKREDVCFGLHFVLNAEWDRVVWGPVSPREAVPTLLDERGMLYQAPCLFEKHPPRMEEILRELQAQYDVLTEAGFRLSYLDSHMLTERYLPGLQEELRRWTGEKGLLYYDVFDVPFSQEEGVTGHPGRFEALLSSAPDGQYLFVVHPAVDSDEMRACGNAHFPGERVAKERQADYVFVCSPKTREICRKHNVRTLAYTEAVPGTAPVFSAGDVLLTP